MPHLDDVIALGPGDDDEHEVHLYLTDYRSLYVAQVDCIQKEDPRLDDADHVPSYYAGESLHCDCWFLLRDVRLLVRDDLESVGAELALLRNQRYAGRPVSLYGGMVDLPLIVSRPEPRTFFGGAERALLTDGQRWAEFDSAQGGVGAIEATLRLDHFGATWSRLEGPARRFITTAESFLRQHRGDPAADLSPVAVSYGKALEVQLNALLRSAMRDAAEPSRYVNVDGRSLRLPDALPLSLRPLVSVLAGDKDRTEHLCHVLHGGGWLVREFAAAVDQFAGEARNPASHTDVVPRDVVLRWRDRWLGVGSDSLMRQLAQVYRR